MPRVVELFCLLYCLFFTSVIYCAKLSNKRVKFNKNFIIGVFKKSESSLIKIK